MLSKCTQRTVKGSPHQAPHVRPPPAILQRTHIPLYAVFNIWANDLFPCCYSCAKGPISMSGIYIINTVCPFCRLYTDNEDRTALESAETHWSNCNEHICIYMRSFLRSFLFVICRLLYLYNLDVWYYVFLALNGSIRRALASNCRYGLGFRVSRPYTSNADHQNSLRWRQVDAIWGPKCRVFFPPVFVTCALSFFTLIYVNKKKNSASKALEALFFF